MSESISFKDILDTAQSEAIADKLQPTERSIYEYFCRQYATNFSTPLSVVFGMDAVEVIRQVLSHRMDSEDEDEQLEKYLDTIYGIEDPEYEKIKEQELADFIENAREDDEERRRLGKPIHPAMAKEGGLPTPPEPPKSKFPKSGGIDLSYLEKDKNNR